MRSLDDILQESSSRHRHLCPRQVLGARMALYASELLELELPRKDKRLLVTAETDGCTVDGLIAATNCHLGSRTLRILDFGKVAATFTDTAAEVSIRIVPSQQSRTLAFEHAPTPRNRWEAMLLGYQAMPAEELFKVQRVQLIDPLSQILSHPGARAICSSCGEEIINGREMYKGAQTLCRSCDGHVYFQIQIHSSSFIN